MGHFCGALAGLLVGIAVLDNRVVETWETWVRTLLPSLTNNWTRSAVKVENWKK